MIITFFFSSNIFIFQLSGGDLLRTGTDNDDDLDLDAPGVEPHFRGRKTFVNARQGGNYSAHLPQKEV